MIPLHPCLKHRQMRGVTGDILERNLVRAEGSLGRLAVHHVWAGPSLWSAQHDQRPAWQTRKPIGAGVILNGTDARVAGVERRGKHLMHPHRLIALDKMHLVAMAAEHVADLVIAGAAKHGRARNLVAVEMQDRQHRTITHRVQERGAKRVYQHIAQLAAFVDRSRRRDADVAWDTAGGRELAEEPPYSLGILRDLWVDLGIGAFEIH